MEDSAGNTGNFIFGGGIPGGVPRPVPTGGLAPASVTTIQIAPSAVTHSQLATDAVTAENIVNGSISTADLASPPSLDGEVSAFSIAALTTTNATIRTVTLNIPSNGRVVANATGMFEFPNNASVDGAWCSITTGTAVSNDNYLVAEERTADALTCATVTSTRFFDVTPGTFTVRLVCKVYAGSASLWTPALNALFIPR